MRFATVFGLSLSVTQPALSFCSEPNFFESAPSFSSYPLSSAPTYQKPSVPFCLSEYSWSGSHTCEAYEIDRYFDEVNAYIDALNSYLDEVRTYANEAREFANSAISFFEEVDRFSQDALSFASCEADDARSQHE